MCSGTTQEKEGANRPSTATLSKGADISGERKKRGRHVAKMIFAKKALDRGGAPLRMHKGDSRPTTDE